MASALCSFPNTSSSCQLTGQAQAWICLGHLLVTWPAVGSCGSSYTSKHSSPPWPQGGHRQGKSPLSSYFADEGTEAQKDEISSLVPAQGQDEVWAFWFPIPVAFIGSKEKQLSQVELMLPRWHPHKDVHMGKGNASKLKMPERSKQVKMQLRRAGPTGKGGSQRGWRDNA